ncbi:OmpH family outer membrane protein [Rhizorhapis suberifaciens]|uniref:Skp family chaperone for outer membrane proteins n=1 Tax=Rhizorhapis suberifaciens TaxID=13656 RepID=A0A840HSH9_9SPHN|nr:OmpH family outer membrane protein [Rhizorhapis suberifaciens]MBB4640530.1 Skp family chaperone for outer membrane proteins [Rhizorhapis suberifaciens]
MKMMLKAAALGLAPIAGFAMIAAPAAAQTKLGVGVADLEQAMVKSTAFTNAMTAMQTTYKTQIDAFNARKTTLDTELQTKANELQAAQKAAGSNTASLQPKIEAFQQRRAAIQQELSTLGRPIAMAQAYVEEQISAKISDALKTAMVKRKVDLVLQPGATVSYQPTVDITDSVTTELNALVSSAQIVPPAGWQPGQQKQQPASTPSR